MSTLSKLTTAIIGIPNSIVVGEKSTSENIVEIKNRSSKKINNEIKKLNETINLAEDLFTKELLDL